MKTHPHISRLPHPLRFVASLLVGLSLGSVALAQPRADERRAEDRRAVVPVREAKVELKRADRSFLERAARDGLHEVEISRIAVERTSNPEIRRFAQTIISDHESAHEELAALATLKGVNLPAKEIVGDGWAKRDAKNFDRDYIDRMVSDHDKTVKLFEKHAREGEDPEVVAFARRHLSKLQQHLHQASDLKRLLKDR